MSRGVCSVKSTLLCVTSLAGALLLGLAARADDLPIPAAKAGVSVSTSAENDDRPVLRSMIREPDLPPDIDAPATVDPTTLTKTAPAPAEKDAPEAAPTEAAKTDPEVVLTPVVDAGAGASPTDIAAAIAALAPVDAKKSPIASLRDWGATRDAVDRFYAARGDMPFWTDAKGFTTAGKAVIARLNRASEDGLDLVDLAVPDGDETTDKASNLAEADIALSEAVIAYANQASGGRIDPIRISPLITAKAAIADPSQALDAVAAATDPGATLAAFNPPQRGYRELREKLAQLRAAYPASALNIFRHPAKARDGADVSPLIRARFETARRSEEIDRSPTSKIAAITELRAPNGRRSETQLDASMTQALAGRGPQQLEAAIIANMEMWRLEPRDMGEERIEVNVPDFTLHVLRGQEELHQARVIVGKPEAQTPIFSNAMRYILVNPSWSVPVSIIKKEMMPKLAEDPDYLKNLGFEVTQHGDMISVKQPPGEKNALGRIAFMFPNEHSVYLHDTPSRSLFSSPRRAFSHGCVRVDQPMRLAEIVMGSGWSEQRFRALIGDTERTVFLPHPLPIHIQYFTAFVDDAGDLQLRDDLYGHMRRIESALGLDVQRG
jgi:L,D-transpeptidase YcbB